MKHRLKVFFLVFLMLFSFCPKVYANDAGYTVNAKAAILMDASSGTVLMSQNEHDQLPPASVTKIMTLLLIYEAIDSGKIQWEDTVTVSEHASSMGGSQVYLEPMEQQTVRDLVKCIAVASANDAAVAMAEYVGGSEEAFVADMNARAKELGMNDTHFENACGLDSSGHLTSAYDIAIMSRELTVNHPQVFEFTQLWQDSITHKTKRGEEEFGLTNTNKLLKWYPAATGLKTGSTGAALYCLAGTAEKEGLQLIAVVLAAPDYKTRFEEVMKMFDYGFANYGIVKGEPAGTPVGEVQVYKGELESVQAVVKDEIQMLKDKDSTGQLETQVDLLPSINAPIEMGTRLGELIYTIDGVEVGRCEVIAAADVQKITFGGMLGRIFNLWYQ